MDKLSRRKALSLLPAAGAAVAAPLVATAAIAGEPIPSTDLAPEQRMRNAAKAYKQAAMEACPEATEWWHCRNLDDGSDTTKFSLIGRIPRPKGWKPPHDPLLALIMRFNEGWERFAGLPNKQADAFYTDGVGRLLDQLTDECPPATTLAGAVAALRMVLRDNEVAEGDVAFIPIVPLVTAALAFLEGRA